MNSPAPKHALVIDDDIDIREVLQVLLESAGFDVDVLADGIDALQLPKPYSVILLDHKMPIFDGARLADYWQLTEPAILDRVILLTGYSVLASERRPVTFASVAKPFAAADLLRVVRECSDRPGSSA